MRMIWAVEVPAMESCTKTPQGGSTSMGDFKTSSVKLGIIKIATEQTISGNIYPLQRGWCPHHLNHT